MLSSSHSKIHDPRITGVSHDPRDADQCQESTKHEWVQHGSGR